MTREPLKSLTFLVTREPFQDYFLIHLVDIYTGVPNGQTEELEIDDANEWFRVRGADMILLDKALTHVWNFYKGAMQIDNYKEPPVRNAHLRPKLD